MMYRSLDSGLLEELTALWNKEIGADFPMRKELLEQNSFQDVNVLHEGSRIAMDDNGQVVGFAVSKIWQDEHHPSYTKDTGWIQVLLVDSSHRGKGIGSTLLQTAEQALKKAGAKKILLGSDLWHYFPGLPAGDKMTADWFAKRGYSRGDTCHDLDCHYNPEELPDIPTRQDAVAEILDEQEKDGLLSFLGRCFPGRWLLEAEQYFERGGTGREFVVLKKGGRIIGFCRINDALSPIIAQNVYWSQLYEGEHGGIGPLGVDDAERGNGYGLFIVEAAEAFLRKRKVSSILIDWTGLVSFYEKLGFKVCKSYDSYSKSI